MAGNRTILVTGATGKQGGALIKELTGKGWTLRAMTRHPRFPSYVIYRPVFFMENLTSRGSSTATRSIRRWIPQPYCR